MHSGEETANAHILDYLTKAGHQVDVWSTMCLPPRWSENTPEEYKRLGGLGGFGKYQWVIWALHGEIFVSDAWDGNKYTSEWSNDCRYIYIAHDALQSIPFPVSFWDLPEKQANIKFQRYREQATFITFHKFHEDWYQARGFKTKRARWFKLDIPYENYNFTDVDPFNDAVLIGVADKTTYRPAPIDHISPFFRKIWCKKYYSSDTIVEDGLCEMPSCCNEAKGTKYCADIAKFWFTMSSGCTFDALVFGSIPFFYQTAEKISDVNELISVCGFPNYKFWPNFGYGAFAKPLKMVFMNWHSSNSFDREAMANKMSLLRRPDVFEETLQTLRDEWFFEDYFQLPSVTQAIQEIIDGK